MAMFRRLFDPTSTRFHNHFIYNTRVLYVKTVNIFRRFLVFFNNCRTPRMEHVILRNQKQFQLSSKLL